MNKKQMITSGALVCAIIVLLLLLSTRIWARVDVSKNRAYTISKVSRELALEIPEQVEVTYFVSDKLRQLYPQPGEIEDLIREYTTYSRGKIRFSARDPVKAGMENRMQELGIPAQQMQIVERNEAAFSMVYSGVLIEYLDRYDVLPVVFSIDTLEYDLTSRIRSLARESVRQAGILVADAGKTLDGDFSNLARALSLAGYKIRPFSAGEAIPGDLPLLVVLGGVETLDDWALYRVDRYIQEGGKALFAVAPVVPEMTQGLFARKLADSGLLAMLKSYGVSAREALLLDPSSMTTTFNSTAPNGAQMVRLIRYPFWVNALPQMANQAHPLGAGFTGAELFWPAPLELSAPSGIEAAALFSSTEDSWLQTDNFTINPDQSYMFTMEQEQTKGSYPLAAAVSGKQQGFYRGKEKPARAGAEEALPDLPETPQVSRLIVVGNTEFAANQFNQSDKNFAFIISACDWLSSDDDIISIRSRAPQTGRLDRVIDQEKRLAAFALVRVINTVLVPLLVLVLGFMFAFNRKKKARRLEQ